MHVTVNFLGLFFGPAKYFSDWQDFHVCQSEWLTTSQQVSGSLPGVVKLINCVEIISRLGIINTGTCFIKKIYAPASSLLHGKHLHFTPSPLRLNIFRLFVILSLTQLYRYTPEIFLFLCMFFFILYIVSMQCQFRTIR